MMATVRAIPRYPYKPSANKVGKHRDERADDNANLLVVIAAGVCEVDF